MTNTTLINKENKIKESFYKRVNFIDIKDIDGNDTKIEKETYPAMLPSEFTPEDMIITELFKEGTEPTEVSKRFDKLEDVSNLTATDLDGVVTLKWDTVPNPKINDEKYLKEYYDKVFERDNYLNNFVSARLNYNKKKIQYNQYLLCNHISHINP